MRVIAAARIMMPRSYVRLSAGRESMSDAAQALCFYAGANSICSTATSCSPPTMPPPIVTAICSRDLDADRPSADHH
jgi:biotin synthase-like enzyme